MTVSIRKLYNHILSDSEEYLDLQAKYVYANGMLLARYDASPADTHYYHHDGLGSVMGMTNENGNVEQSYFYDEFGNSLGSWGSVSNSYLYTGQEYDGAISGLYNLRARYYDPGVGRFISEDPVLQSRPKEITYCLRYDVKDDDEYFVPLQLNVYLYVTDNPINFIDPLGLNGRLGPFLPPGFVLPPKMHPECIITGDFTSWWDCFTYFASEYRCYEKRPFWQGPWERYINPPHCPFYRIAWANYCYYHWKHLRR